MSNSTAGIGHFVYCYDPKSAFPTKTITIFFNILQYLFLTALPTQTVGLFFYCQWEEIKIMNYEL